MRAFIAHSLQSAPAPTRPFLAAVGQASGFIADAAARLAESPVTLTTVFGLFKAFDATTLAPDEREVVVFELARRNDCHICVAMHSMLMTRRQASPELIAALRAGAPLPGERLPVLADFTHEVLERAGDVRPEVWSRFLAAGFTRAQALEVVLGIGTFTMTTLANRLTEAVVDAPLAPFAPSR